MDFKLSALDVRAMEPADYVYVEGVEEFYRRATQCSVDLNGQITLDEGKGPIRGSRSLVYSGTLRQGVAENKVAVKVYSGLPANEDLLKRILAEIQLWSTLRHENIVRVLGVSTNFGLTISIISDWMGMGDAHAYVQNTQNDPRPLLMDIAAGLHYLHTHKLGPIIHCDLNGRNVLVSNDRRALLADFYSSVFMYPNSDMDPDPPRGGSFRWMAPELLDNYAPSPAGDVWAFGMVVLELFTQLAPFHESSGIAPVMLRILTGRLPDRPTEESTCSRMTDPWWDICLSCRKHEPSRRPTISQILQKIREIMRLAPPQVETDQSMVLQEVCKSAARYCINLNDQVEIDNKHFPRRGGAALVRRGVLRKDGKETMVAVKTFYGVPPSDMDALKRILREVHIGSKLHHENIVRLLGVSTQFGVTISIISDWMELGDAHNYVQDIQNDPRPLLKDIATGLQYLHTHELGPICHGDLKGPNVLVSNDHRALLTDFGLSTLTKSTLSLSVDSPRGGTFAWMAPELLDEYNSSVASDVWAYGMTALELFSRSIPFHGRNHNVNIVTRIVMGRLPDRPTEESTCHRMTDAWWNICLSCWQKEPPSRPTISDILQQITEMMGYT